MNIERYLGLPFEVIELPDDQRIIRLQNVYGSGDVWPSLALANHNVFRLGAAGGVVWQVRRVEVPGRPSWEHLHELARSQTPGIEGYFDPFWSMQLDEHLANPDQPGTYRPGCKIVLRTQRMWYALDVETGVATATGEEFR